MLEMTKVLCVFEATESRNMAYEAHLWITSLMTLTGSFFASFVNHTSHCLSLILSTKAICTCLMIRI